MSIESQLTRPVECQALQRWGGAFLCLGALIFVVTMILYIAVLGSPVGTGEGGEVTSGDSANHLLETWALAKSIWIAESVAIVLLALAGFVLAHAGRAKGSVPPQQVSWVMLGVGAIINSIMYALVLGVYPVAAAAHAEHPVVFASARAAAFVLFYLGNTVMYFGLAGALFSEATVIDRLLPKWTARVGGSMCFVCAVLIAGMLVGVGSMMLAAPFALLGFVFTSWFGLKMAISAGGFSG